MYYITDTRNDKEQVGTYKLAYNITQTFLMMLSKKSQEYWLTHPQLTSLSKPKYI